MTDRFVVRAVVVSLAAATMLGMALTAWLVSRDTPADSVAVIASMAGTALGALATLLARTSVVAEQVEVVNEPTEPVPVAATRGGRG